METISVDGEKYIKASSIAKELGYTADYVGQLARAKKVKATLVGRTWYVKESSIRSHKTTRYRTAATKSKQEIKRVLSENEMPETHNKSVKNFSYLKNSYHPTVKYESDEEDLIPILTEVGRRSLPGKSKELEVELGDAEKVKVRSVEKAYHIETSVRPKLTFSGHLRIDDAESPVLNEKPKRSGTIKIEKLDLKKLTKTATETESPEPKSKPKKPRGKGHHIGVIEEGPEVELVKIHAIRTKSAITRRFIKGLTTLAFLSLAISIALASLMLEARTSFTATSLNYSYSLNKEVPKEAFNMAKNIVISAIR